MGDHVVLSVDGLVIPEDQNPEDLKSSGEGSSSKASDHFPSDTEVGGEMVEDSISEEEPLIQLMECRICQDEDNINNLETPCACSGSLKFAHRKCVQLWCNEKGDTTCEICHQPYQPGYTAPAPLPQPEDATIDISESWMITGNPMDFHNPRLLAMAAAERHLLEAEYDYGDTNDNGAAFCRSAALILLALLLLRHALSLTTADDEDDISTFFSIFLLRAAGFLLPCYIMAWAISILQARRQRQEAVALAAAEVAFMLQAGQSQDLHITIAPGSAVTPHQEPGQ